MPRLDTTLEAAGAEHLVIGRLLIEHLQAFRAQSNQPRYDILVVDSNFGTSVKVQVKSRTASDGHLFKIQNDNFDFVVFALLNRGTRASLKAASPEGKLDPEFYVVPVGVIRKTFPKFPARVRRSWVLKNNNYRENWISVKQALRRRKSGER